MKTDHSTKKIVALTLRISVELLEELDEAAYRKRMSRTAFMRESLTRNLAYFLEVESKTPAAKQAGR
jgi:predicted transcriptional regulator